MKNLLIIYLVTIIAFSSYQCSSEIMQKNDDTPFIWENATVYFLLTDRFNNGDSTNDLHYGRTDAATELRKFMGGDIQGITQKIEEGYFTDLGVNAIWLSPVVEQIHGGVDEGQGNTYGYHGYWAKDWTSFEPNFGSEADFEKLMQVAHANGIRILLDVVINQTGPVTDTDPCWPDSWVRTEPSCTYQDLNSTVSCTLTNNLPDIRTDSNEEVELPQLLKDKWEKEGRLEKEMAELDAFFARTGYPRAPRFYIIKWLTDYIKKYGIDGFRVDTVKHVEVEVWGELWKEAIWAFNKWKAENPEKVIDDNEFYMVGEVYGYNIHDAQNYHYSDTTINYFEQGFNSMINFAFKYDANKKYEDIFSQYSTYLHDSLQGKWVMNYLCSHDDSQSFDKERENPIDAGTRLLLAPGAAQIYYGDETSRKMVAENELGDANLRTFMNWDELEQNAEVNGLKVQDVLTHWQKIGQFRKAHPSIGAGKHTMVSESPYLFKREYNSETINDMVVVGLDLPIGEKEIILAGVFEDGTVVEDFYSEQSFFVENGGIYMDSEFSIVLLSESK